MLLGRAAPHDVWGRLVASHARTVPTEACRRTTYPGAAMTETTPHVYLDHAATTPMVPEAVEVMVDLLARTGNANSLHGSGRAARKVVVDTPAKLGSAA